MTHERTVLSTMAWNQTGNVLVLCTGDKQATATEIDTWLERLAKHDYECLLIWAVGEGGIDSKQRARIAGFWKAAPRSVPPGAMMTDRPIARFVMTAINWLVGGHMHAFDIDDWDGACAALGQPVDVAAIKHTATQLRSALTATSKRQSA